MKHTHCNTTCRSSFAIAAVMLFLAALLAQAAVAQEVVFKPVPNDDVAIAVYLRNPTTGETTKFATIDDVYRDHYHPAEYRKGSLYVIKRQGTTSVFDTDSNYTDELWRYSADGEGEKLWSVPGLDFRVNSGGTMIALTGSPKENNERTLYIIKPNGELIKSYAKNTLKAADLEFGGWVGTDLWMKEQQTIDIYSLIRIDTNNLQTQRYDLSGLGLVDSDYSFNPQSLMLAYSSYPVFFDADSEADFVEANTPVKLYVYDLKTQERKQIAQSSAKKFNPKWLDESTLEYDNPRGEGRTTAKVSELESDS